MENMTLEEFNEVFEDFEKYYGCRLTTEKKSIYYIALAEITKDQFEMAFVRIVREREFTNLPSVAEIRKYGLGLKEDDLIVRSEIAKQKLRKAVNTYGAYQTVAFDDPAIHAVIDSVEGNWYGLCRLPLDEYQKFFEFTFSRIYKAYYMMPYQVSLKFTGIHDKNNENINLKIVGNAEKYLTWTKKIETVENLLTGKGQKYNAIEVI